MVSFSRFPVATAEALAADVINDTVATGNKEITESKPFTELKRSKESYTKSFNKVKASPHTVRLMAADENRDNRWIGLRTYTLAHTYSWLPDVKAAADQMMAVLDAHGTGIESLAHGEESGKIHKILDDLGKPIYRDSIAKMVMEPWIGALATSQNNFELVDSERTTERASIKDIASATKERRVMQVDSASPNCRNLLLGNQLFDFNLLRFCLFCLGQGQGQDTILIDRFDLVFLHIGWQRVRTKQ